MGTTSLYTLPLLLALGTTPTPVQTARPGPPMPGGYLSPEDAVYLDYLVHEFLFDPKHAVRVRLSSAELDSLPPRLRIELARYSGSRPSDGWLVRGPNGKADRIYFTDGDSIPVPAGRISAVNFEMECASQFGDGGNVGFDSDDDALTIAAWLHCRGYDGLASRALAAARARREDENPEDRLRDRLASRAYERIFRAFYERRDAEAIAQAERLYRVFPQNAEDYPELPTLVADLKRRIAAPAAAKPLEKSLPKEFVTWDIQTRLTYLLDSLQEVEVTTRRDFRIDALVELGDAAVPALIDALERDERLTRCPQLEQICGLGQRNQGRLVPVHNVVLQALGAILRCEILDPHTHRSSLDEASHAAMANQFRRYWARYGRLAFDDRMMAILTDAKATGRARSEAALELIRANRSEQMSWTEHRERRSSVREGIGSLLSRYKSPTVREAIWEALEQSLVKLKAPVKESRYYRGVESEFIRCLVELGDRKAGPELALRAAKAESPAMRFEYAEAANRLGVPGALLMVIRDIGAGRYDLSGAFNNDDNLGGLLHGAYGHLVSMLSDCEIPEAEEAFFLLTDPAHPYYPLLAAAVRSDPDSHPFGPGWARHQNCLIVLSQALKDGQKTGVHYYLRDDEIEVSLDMRRRRANSREKAPAGIAMVEHAEQRVGDAIADRIAEIVVGVTTSNPLRADADARLAKLKAELDLYSRRFRRATWDEQEQWSMRIAGVGYVPDLRPLGRPATTEDVKLGRAVFQLSGQGKVAEVKPSTWVVLKTLAKESDSDRGLVVQAETGANGKLIYGVIFRHEIRTVKAEEVEVTATERRDMRIYRSFAR